jgi:AcrR family transcriptional regulator
MSRNVAKRKIDRRVLRTRDRLGDALLEIMRKKPFDTITVQHVLDRAGVSRSTFYTHYGGKSDLFLSDADEFLEGMATVLSRTQDSSNRVAAVRELFAHIAEECKLYAVLVASGQIHEFLELAQGHFARGIEQRLADIPGVRLSAAERGPVAHGLAGTLLSLLSWWINRSMPTSPTKMDDLYHRIVWTGVEREITLPANAPNSPRTSPPLVH